MSKPQTISVDGLDVTVSRSQIDGHRVVQIETHDVPEEEWTCKDVPPMRVYINDAGLYQCDEGGRERYDFED